MTSPQVKPQDNDNNRYVYLEATNGPNDKRWDQHACYDMNVIAYNISESSFLSISTYGPTLGFLLDCPPAPPLRSV